MMFEQITLTETDRQSALWGKLLRHFEKKLQQLRSKNDEPLDENKTAVLRGRIQELKAIISMDKEIPEFLPQEF